MASIRKRIDALSAVIDTLGNGGPVWYPDPETLAEVEAIVTGKVEILPLSTERVEEIEKELDEIAKNYRMPLKKINR